MQDVPHAVLLLAQGAKTKVVTCHEQFASTWDAGRWRSCVSPYMSQYMNTKLKLSSKY